MLQVKVAVSFAANDHVADVEFVKPVGPAVAKPFGSPMAPPLPSPDGGVRSIVQTRETPALVFPAVSVARTENVCVAARRPDAVYGELHGVQTPVSSRHSYVAVSFALKEIDTDVWFVVAGGPELIVTTGAVPSAVVVNDQVTGAATAEPSSALTVVATVAVYVAEVASSAFGLSVTVCVVAL